MVQPELLELHPAKVMDVRGVPFHLPKLEFHFGLGEDLCSSTPTIRDFCRNFPEPLHQRDQIQSRRALTGNAGAGITLITPTSVCIPFSSQRTSSQSRQL